MGQKKILLKNPVLIDGLSRSGKSIISKILPTLNKSEHLKVFTYFEHIMPALHYKEIKQDFANAQLITMTNEIAYNTFLGRDVNFRPSDYSSVTTKHLKNRYLNRLKQNEGDTIVKKLTKTNFFFPFMTHEIMPNLDKLNKMSLKFKIIEFYRNPIDNVFSWMQKNICNNFVFNPRSFTLATYDKKRKKNIPWFCGKESNTWFKLNAHEQNTYAVCKLIKDSIRKQKNNNKTSILTISFENFYTNPFSNLKKICKFLKSKKTKFTNEEIIKAQCPRKENLKLREEKKLFIKERVSKKLFLSMVDLENQYKKDLYGLK